MHNFSFFKHFKGSKNKAQTVEKVEELDNNIKNDGAEDVYEKAEQHVSGLLKGLNEAQMEAVQATEGYIRVIAGAGSGKTKSLSHRYAFLVNELGVLPENILCVTFTNKAANEMKRRIRRLIGEKDVGYVCTFHGFCVQLLKEDIHFIDYPKNFIIMDEADSKLMLDATYENLGISTKVLKYDKAREMISKEKNDESYIEYFADKTNDKLIAAIKEEENLEHKIFLSYLLEQKKNFALDFDDLINLALYLLEIEKEVAEKWKQRLMYIMVDEFQDVNSKQYRLVKILSTLHKNLFVVGDPDQTIYSWRGADVRYILEFDSVFKNTRTIYLNKNYRSTPEILNVSNSLIKHNQMRLEKELSPVCPHGQVVEFYHGKSQSDEARWIVSQIQSLVKSNKVSFRDIVILYRAHYLSKPLEDEFLKCKIPYVLYSGVEFYKRTEIKDVLSYIRFVVQKDDISFKRIINVPSRGFGKKRLEHIEKYASEHKLSCYEALKECISESTFQRTKAKDFIEMVEKLTEIYNTDNLNILDFTQKIMDVVGYEKMLRDDGEEERLDNLAALKQSMYEYLQDNGRDTTIEDFLQSIALYTNMDKKESKDSIKLMTIHSAKGLEFPCVFVCGLNENIFPSKKIRSIEEMEEERRLAYVAYTRAAKYLYLTEAEGTTFTGEIRYPSRFIFNVNKKFLDYKSEIPEYLLEDAKLNIAVSEKALTTKNCNLKEGDRVKHDYFGVGTIINISRDLYTVKFDNLQTARNISRDVKLTRI